MLIPDNIHPENTIYYNGSVVLKILLNVKEIELLDLFQETIRIKKMSFQVFILCLDWLYLIDTAKFKNGTVKLCI